jgi:serine/threonine protein kinase
VPSNLDPHFAGAEFRPGDAVAERYRVVSVLGSGPYSVVYKVEDVLTRDVVALKLIAPTAVRDNSVVSRYRMELNLFRQIEHPGLVRISDFGDYLGRIFVAMERIEGTTLRDRLKSGKLSWDEFTRVFTGLCDAISELHTQHVAHRDLHPGNIMLTTIGAKLMDFGIARDQRRARGSPEAAYAAPEQLMGQAATLATDIYSIGALSYEMLTGRAPQAGSKTAGPIDSEIEAAGPGIGAVIEACLQIDPIKRFQNVQALRSAADRIFAASQSRSVRVRLEDLKTVAAPAPEEMTKLFARIARALIGFHASGREHAELAPSNIRVSGEGVEFETRANAATPSGQATLLISDAKYTAPELVLARRAPDQAAHVCGDIYVLGFVFYELLVGKEEMLRQFAEAEQLQTGLAWMRWHSDPRSILRPLAEAAPACPKGVAELIERMTRKEPTRRVQTLEEVAETLERLSVGLARTQPFILPTPQPAGRRKRKSGLLIALASALVLLAAILGAGRLTSRLSAPKDTVARVWDQVTGRKGTPSPTESGKFPAILQTSAGALVLVPAGEFVMGSGPEHDGMATHRVKTGDYYIDRMEVSNRYFREFCARTGRPAPQAPAWDPNYSAKDDFPALNVDRDAAVSFCQAVGKRLPTEEEWEKAAGGADTLAVIWGNWTLPGLSNLKSEGRERPARVGSFAADVSPYGVLDAAGNVQEWVAGDFKPRAAATGSGDAPEPPVGVVRGGSFATPASGLSPAWRAPMPLAGAARDLSSVGFRCAVDARAGLALANSQIASTSRGESAP